MIFVHKNEIIINTQTIYALALLSFHEYHSEFSPCAFHWHENWPTTTFKIYDLNLSETGACRKRQFTDPHTRNEKARNMQKIVCIKTGLSHKYERNKIEKYQKQIREIECNCILHTPLSESIESTWFAKKTKRACINVICYPSNRITACTRKQYEYKKKQMTEDQRTWSEERVCREKVH